MNISQITKIEDGQVFYLEHNIEKTINLKKSSEIWYDFFHKDTFLDKILKKRKKNIYAGIKNFCIDGISYIKLFDTDCEYLFEIEVNENNLIERRKEWDEINCKINGQGFWLFDWS